MVSWKPEGQTKTAASASRLLGSRLKVVLDRWDVPHHRSGGHILYYWTFPMGEVVYLRSRGTRGGLTIDEYIVMYCYPDMEKVGSQIRTNSIQVLGLKAILLTLGRIAGLASLH